MKLDELYAKFIEEGASCMDEEVPDYEELLQIAKTQVLAVPEAPYSWLFPQCSCVVHVGSTGTMQAAYEADCPQVIMNIGGDYPSMADLVPEMPPCQDVGKPLLTMKPEDLASAIEQSVQYEEPVKEVGTLIREEMGTEDAADIIEEFLTKEVKTGKWKTKFNKRMVAKCNPSTKKVLAHSVPCAAVKAH